MIEFLSNIASRILYNVTVVTIFAADRVGVFM